MAGKFVGEKNLLSPAVEGQKAASRGPERQDGGLEILS